MRRAPVRVGASKRTMIHMGVSRGCGSENGAASGGVQDRIGALAMRRQRLVQELQCDVRAAAALGGDTQLAGEVAQAAGAVFDARADLRIGDTVAETDIHESSS